MERGRYPGLEIEENRPQQRREWVIQRVAWFFLYLLLIGIALGLLGEGPLSDARLEGSPANSMQMEYSRFLRNKSPGRLKISVPAHSGEVRVVLDARYLEEVEIEKVSPEPEQVLARADGRLFIFKAASDAAKPVQIEFRIRPQQPGRLQGWIAVADGLQQPFRQFVYP